MIPDPDFYSELLISWQQDQRGGASPEVKYEDWAPHVIDQREIARERPAGFDGIAEAHVPVMAEADVLLHFLPIDFLRDSVQRANTLRHTLQLSFGEFLRWLGLWLLISLYPSTNRDRFWTKSGGDSLFPLPYLGELMSKHRFKDILTAFAHTDGAFAINPPSPDAGLSDPFWTVRGLYDAWCTNMSRHFVPSSRSTLDESMVPNSSPENCPGYMQVNMKPTPKGNMVNTIACVQTQIIYYAELVEGADRPPHRRSEFAEQGAMTGLVLRMTRRIWGKGDIVFMDSRFCTVKGLLALLQHGVYATMCVKKKSSWPHGVDGEDMEKRLQEEKLGTCLFRHGVTVPSKANEAIWNFYLVGMKDTFTVSKYLTTWGTSLPSDCMRYRCSPTGAGFETFVLPEVVKEYYAARHAVDDNNRLRQGICSIEENCRVYSWPFRQFLFLFSVSEINALQACRYFVPSHAHTDHSLIDFRRNLARQLIHNKYLADDHRATEEEGKAAEQAPTLRRSARLAGPPHQLMTRPPYGGMWDGTHFSRVSNPYPRHQCKGPKCTQRIRTYCSCTPTLDLCIKCYYEWHLKMFE
jgi:hypothetical protein